MHRWDVESLIHDLGAWVRAPYLEVAALGYGDWGSNLTMMMGLLHWIKQRLREKRCITPT